MADWHAPQGPFDIAEVPDYIPRRLKPYLFIFFVLIVQFSGGVYLAAASDMVGTTALMQEDILMAGYASLIGMSINFCVMFRIKFRYSTRTQLLVCGTVMMAANAICAVSDCVPLLVGVCLVAGFFRMQATLACNSTIQLWLTPKRDMSVFFCYVYIIVDSVIQLSGIASIYVGFHWGWEYMQWIMIALLALMLLMVMILVRPIRGPMFIPLLGIDWIGAILWAGVMMCFTFICVYGNYFDWWEASEMRWTAMLGCVLLGINLWRMSFLHHPYVSLAIFRYRNLIIATCVYLVFNTLLATEHVFEHSYTTAILGFDDTNLIDLNLYVFIGIIAGCAFTYYAFALRKWRYKNMTVIAFALAAVYLAYFYFTIDYGIEKEMLFIPLFVRGSASVIISIIFLTLVQGGLPFQVFPQALVINGFTGAVMGATLGPAIIGEWLRHTMARNAALLSTSVTDRVGGNIGTLYGMVQRQALVVSIKEIYGWLLIAAIIILVLLATSYGPLRPNSFFPKWKTVRRILRHTAKVAQQYDTVR